MEHSWSQKVDHGYIKMLLTTMDLIEALVPLKDLDLETG